VSRGSDSVCELLSLSSCLMIPLHSQEAYQVAHTAIMKKILIKMEYKGKEGESKRILMKDIMMSSFVGQGRVSRLASSRTVR
jgi:hypothetical protein